MAVKKFRAYVEMMPFTIIADHASLKWLMHLKDLTGRLARWSLQIQAFDFEIEHRKGSENVVADMLSRSPQNLVIEELTKENYLDFETNDFQSEEYLELLSTIRENQEKLPDLKINEGLIFKKTVGDNNFENDINWKLWIPSTMTEIIIGKAHNSPTESHGGITKTSGRIKRFFYCQKICQKVSNL